MVPHIHWMSRSKPVRRAGKSPVGKSHMNPIFKGKRVLITGGTGSFGSEFTKFALKDPGLKKLIIFSRDEYKQHHLEKELNDHRVSFFIGDVRDLKRLERAFSEVDIVIHAAALKQVPALEYNPFEAVKTNILGTQNVIEAAVNQGVRKVLFVSTDKAVQPVNLYGATKLSAEKLFVAGNAYSPKKTMLSVVRYGNVVGSRGSIIEILQKNKGAEKVYITDLEMTRFWITLPQSLQLVMFALENMVGGEIFVPKIPSMKITDLFDTLAPQAHKEVVGIRPGEKVHEMLITEHEASRGRSMKECFVILPNQHDWSYEYPYGKYDKLGKKLPTGFTFTSHNNDAWLTPQELKNILSE
jgi:UDP-N-acetylglucosamine 4,6-dehydratase